MTDISIARGDTLTLDVAVIDGQPPNVVAQSVTGWSFWMTIKRSLADADPGVAQPKYIDPGPGTGITIVDADEGRLRVETPTTGFPVGTLVWDLQAKDSSGRVKTLDRGRLFVLQDVTLAT